MPLFPSEDNTNGDIMSSERTPLISKSLTKGQYAPSTSSDLRSPCPLINCLANHGHIPRDGRSVRASELTMAMNEIGLSTALGAVFANPIFNEHKIPGEAQLQRSFLGKLWDIIWNPWSLLTSFGMRRAGQKDTAGKAVLNLDQLALPGVVEHDVSLSRRDHAQGDNLTRQPDLIRDLLNSSSDGGKTLTMADLAALRKRRIETQTIDNPGRVYGSLQHQIGCTEIALVLDVFGDGKKISCDYARAFFQEERLPISEGWHKRQWWRTLGFIELAGTINKIKQLIGMKF